MKTVFIERNKLFKNINMVLFNNITTVDEDFIENNMDLFFRECEECNGSGEDKDGKTCEECYGEGRFDLEAYQYFAVDVGKWEIERLKEYGVEVGYSEKCDMYILPIYDYGTSWSAFSYSKEVEDDYTLYPDETFSRTTVY